MQRYKKQRTIGNEINNLLSGRMKKRNPRGDEKKKEKIEMRIFTIVAIILIINLIYSLFLGGAPEYDYYSGRWFNERLNG